MRSLLTLATLAIGLATPALAKDPFYVDDAGHFQIDQPHFAGNALFQQGTFGAELVGDLVFDTDGFGVGVVNAPSLTKASIRSNLVTIANYLVMLQSDRETSSMIAFKYDIPRDYKVEALGNGLEQACSMRTWKKMVAHACITAIDTPGREDPQSFGEATVRLVWPERTRRFMRADRIDALAQALCESPHYTAEGDGCDKIADPGFTVTVRPVTADDRFSRISIGRNASFGVLKLEPNIRLGPADLSAMRVYVSDGSGFRPDAFRELSAEEKAERFTPVN